VTNYKFGPSWKKAIIVGITGKALYRIRREVGCKKVKTVNMKKLKQRHCENGEGPSNQDQNEPGRDTRGRRIPNKDKLEDKNANKEASDDNPTVKLPQQEETRVQNKPEEEEKQQELERDKQVPDAAP
jgi:hypothetical protein